jgi:hypothetical protein
MKWFYQAFVLSFEGSVITQVDLFCDDDDAAKERAKALVVNRPVELWHGGRLIARFNPDELNR